MKATSKIIKMMAIVITITMILSLLPANVVLAADTTVNVIPESSTAYLCNDTILSIWVYDVVDLYGYDIYLKWDNPSAIEVYEVKNGDFLDTNSWLFTPVIDNVNGSLHVAMNQFNPQTPKSGDGQLIEIRIRNKTPGVTVTFDIITQAESTEPFWTEVLDVNGTSLPYAPANGSISITNECPFTAALSISPATSSACYLNVYSFDVWVDNAVDLWAYDLRISYDPAVISIISKQNGGFLELGLTVDTSTVGTISYTNTQQTPQLPKTGSGKLLTVSYIVIGPSGASVNLSILSNSKLRQYVDPPTEPAYVIDVPYTATNGIIYTGTCEPNAVDLLYFDVLRKKVRAYLTWETANELDNAGFNIYRSGRLDGIKRKINPELIPAQAAGTTMGAVYEYKDKPLKPWKTYYYWLEWIDFEGNATLSDPVKAEPPLKK